jgi:hypothetical protein
MKADEGCLICGTTDELTVEHIIPQTLWKRFGLDPDHDDLARYRTTLCQTHNQATSALHRRSEAIRLIATGEPVTTKTLAHLADWAVWVTLLLGLANGHGVLRPGEAAAYCLIASTGALVASPEGSASTSRGWQSTSSAPTSCRTWSVSNTMAA